MPSVFKLGRDKNKKNAPWYFEYKDQDGSKRMKKGFTDKATTEQLAVKLETEARMRSMGLIDADQENKAKLRNSPLKQHLKDFRKSLEAKDNTEKNVNLLMKRVVRIVEGCEFATLADISADGVEQFMAELRTSEDLGNRTYNHYLQGFDSFCNWLVDRKKLDRNPAAGIARLNTEADVRHQRRALTPDEFAKLVKSARESGKEVQRYSGELRARLYIVSYMTGLRRGELASLTRESFNLTANPPTLTVQAGASKHRRKDVLPLHPELVDMLRDWLDELQPGEPLFPKVAKKKCWFMVQKDLERVDIPYKNEQGVADFHAAGRHTHITELIRNGASVPQAKELARHSDVRMTMKYTHIGIDDQAKALAALPSPCQDIVRKRRDSNGREASSVGTDCHDEATGKKSENPRRDEGYDATRRAMSQHGTKDAQRRARDSNPQRINPQLISNQPPHQFGYPPGFRQF